MSVKPAQRDFFELVKAIGESKSKQEEDRIIADEVRKKSTLVVPFITVLTCFSDLNLIRFNF